MTTIKYTIHRFTGEYSFLSNFYPQPVLYEDVWYMTVEHAYHAAKTLDPTQREKIALMPHAGDAKSFGQSIILREGWNDLRVPVMALLLDQKFESGSLLALKLLDTYPKKLIEGNTWGDTFWGMCNGIGSNELGKLLMERRAVLRKGK